MRGDGRHLTVIIVYLDPAKREGDEGDKVMNQSQLTGVQEFS